MRTRGRAPLRRGLVGLVACLGLLVLTVAPATATVTANAGDDADTTTTFTLASGALFVTVPAAADLGEIATSSELLGGTTATSTDFGEVTVTDERGDLIATWTATATGTDFVLEDGDGTDPAQSVAAGEITYDPGALLIVGTDGVGTGGTASTLEDGATVEFVGVGTNEVSWTPSLTFELSENQVSGDYEGTITHSVS